MRKFLFLSLDDSIRSTDLVRSVSHPDDFSFRIKKPVFGDWMLVADIIPAWVGLTMREFNVDSIEIIEIIREV